MRQLKLSFFAFMLFSAPAWAEREMSIPEAQPGTQQGEYVRSIIEQARNNPAMGYQSATYYTVKTEAATFAPNSDGLIEFYLLVNGKFFFVPTDVHYVDNWVTYARRRDGIYLINRGHRWIGNVLYRVIATMKMTQLDGTAFPVLRYSETKSIEPCPQCLR